jgi:uncharacterized membrane protein YecN with MAPEG domain
MPITGLYAALLSLILLFLWSRVSATRMKTGIALGHGDDPELTYRIRRHANFVEHVPMALILFAVVERGGAQPAVVHALGATLLVARILHPLGIGEVKTPNPLRALGAGATFLVILVAAALALWQLVSAR